MKRLFGALILLGVVAAHGFEIQTFEQQIPESNPVMRTRVTDGRNRFSFITPNGWRAQSDAPGKRMSLQKGDSQSIISMRFAMEAMPATAEQFKAHALRKIAGAKVLEEFAASSGGGKGLGIDVAHAVSGVPLITRLVVFPGVSGSVEVSLAAPPQEFESLHIAWTGFINSFRIEPVK